MIVAGPRASTIAAGLLAALAPAHAVAGGAASEGSSERVADRARARHGSQRAAGGAAALARVAPRGAASPGLEAAAPGEAALARVAPIRHLSLSGGARLLAGSHDAAATITATLDGLYELPLRVRGFQLGLVGAADVGLFAQQWGWPFRGLQLELSVFALVGHRLLSLGVGVRGYVSRSLPELAGADGAGEDDLSITDQRVGVVLLQSQFGGRDGRQSTLRLRFANDVLLPAALLFGDGGDAFRTVDVDLGYHLATPGIVYSLVLGASMRTGLVDHDRVDPLDPRYVDMTDQPWSEFSTGLVQATVAVTLAVDPRRGGGELALALGLGVDAERLRDRIQNGFHDLIGDKRIPLVDRPDRLYGGLSLAYRFGVALRGRGGASLRSPARLVLAGQRP